jgi:hypothetical protein
LATLIKAREPEAVKAATPTVVKKWYNELAEFYNRIIQEKLIRCNCCGNWLAPDAYYSDNRYAGGKFFACKRCVQAMVEQCYKRNDVPNETKESVQYVLHMMDLPYLDVLYEKCLKGTLDDVGERSRRSPFATYITCVKSLPQYKGKKWKDSEFPEKASEHIDIDPKTIKIFGKDFSDEDYKFLESQYRDWVERTKVDTKSQETYVVQICLQLLDIQKDRREGKDVTNKLKALDVLMNAANLQPKQNVNNAATDSLTFGQLIEKWEEEKPIPEPSPEFKDCDGIGHYIRVWFMGHLAKMLGLKNAYSKEYEDEIAKYSVRRSQSQEEGRSEEIYEAMFGKSGD